MVSLKDLITHIENGRFHPFSAKYLLIVRIQNLLSSFRGYIDSFAHALSDNLGKESDAYIVFNQLKTEYYESNFSYFFIEQIRNFAQHRDIPLHELKKSRENGKIIIKLISKKSILLADSKIKGKDRIRSSTNEDVDLVYHLKTMFGLLCTINHRVFEIVYNAIDLSEYWKLEEQYCKNSEFLILFQKEISLQYTQEHELKIIPFDFSRVRFLIEEYQQRRAHFA